MWRCDRVYTIEEALNGCPSLILKWTNTKNNTQIEIDVLMLKYESKKEENRSEKRETKM